MTNAKFDMNQESVEAGLLAAIDQKLEHYLAIEAAGIKTDDFIIHKQIFLFFQQYLQEYGGLPSNSQISARFQWQPPVGDFAYWLVEMRRYALAQKVLQAVQDVYHLAAEPEKALSLALERFSLLRASSNGHVQASDFSAQERYEKYLARQQFLFGTTDVLGLRTGLRVIDDTRQGWMPGELIGIYARSNVGKTWWALWQGALAWMQGKSVLAISPEMPAKQFNLRIDVVLGHMLGWPLEYNKIMAGDPSQQDHYQRVTQAMAQEKRWWTYDSMDERAVGLGDLSALIRLHKPDLVLVDGIMLLRYEGRKQSTWEIMDDLSYGMLHLTTIHEVPAIITHQAVNTSRGLRREVAMVGRGDDFMMPTLNNAAGGEGFVRACSTIFTMAGDPSARYVQWYSLRKLRERAMPENIPARMGMAWDPGTGQIIDLGYLGNVQEAVGNEARRLLGLDKIR